MFMDIDFDKQPSDLAATSARAGSKFKPKARPWLRKHVSVSTSRTISNDANEMLSTQPSVAQVASENFSYASLSEIHVPDSDTINQSTHEKLPEENVVDVLSGAVHCCMEPTDLHARTHVDSEKQRCDDKDEDIHTQTKSIQPEEEEGCLDLESLKIVQEGTSAYGQHTEKFQPKPRFHSNVIEGHNYGVNEEASEPHYSADDIGHISTDSSDPYIVNEEPRNEAFNMKQSGRERNMRKSKRATSEKSRAAQKRKKTSEEPNQCSKKPQKKKNIKHSTPRLKRTLEKELLEIPDDEIRFLPIRDLLRLVDYKEWLEKKEANRRKGSQSQESTSKASDNQYSQDDTENFESDEYRENQESSRVKPDSPVNYQTYSHKTARSHWSKQDTELFYEGIQEFGSNFSMVQQLFPNRSRQQLKLKYKLEERKHPLKLNGALTSRSKHHIHYQNVIKKFQQEAAARKAEQEEEEDEAETAGEGATEAEAETNDVPENAKYEEPETAGDAQVEDENSLRLDEAEAENDQLSNGGDDDEAECDYWASYKSDM